MLANHELNEPAPEESPMVAGPVRLEAPSGVALEERRHDDGTPILALRAPDGTVVVEYRPTDGTCRIHAPRVEVVAARDLDLRAGERVCVDAGRHLALSCGDTEIALGPDRLRLDVRELEASATHTRWTSRTFALVSDAVETEARRIVQRAGEVETHARRVVERARESFRDVEELAQTSAGRLRLVAKHTLHAMGRRTLLKAREDMKLRAERIDLS
jgi:hypothetical protein